MPPTIVENSEGIQDVEISQENGYGHETMGDFVRHHMQCILQPFADHVDELHKAVDLLQNDLIETTNLAQSNLSRLDRHDELLLDLRNDTDNVTGQARATAKLLDASRAERQLLEADHGKTKRDVAAVTEELQATRLYVFDQQHGLSATNANVEELQRVTRATDDNIARSLDPAIAALRVDLTKLDGRAAATQTLLDKTKAYGEGVHTDVQRHLQEYELELLKSERMFAHVHDSTKDLTETIKGTEHRLQTQAEHLKTTNAMVRPLKLRAEQMGASIKVQEQKHADVVRELTDFLERFAQTKIQLDKLVEKFGADDDDKKKGASIFETVSKLSETLSRACANISNIEATTELHDEVLKKDEERMDASDVLISETMERVSKCEDKIGFNDPPEPPPPKASKWGAARKSCAPDTSGQGIANIVKMMSISQQSKKSKEKLDRTAEDLENTKANLVSTKDELKEAESRVKVLEAGLTNTNEMVSKLGLGLDLNQEYWSGLSKGFRDTHKAVAIDNDMLPAKGSHAVTLPAIPSSGMHPNSPKLPGPKRPVSQGGRPAPHTAR